MTKAKTIRHPATGATAPTIGAATAEAKPKRRRGKFVDVDGSRATTADATSLTRRVTDTSVPDVVLTATPKPPRQTKAAMLRAMLARPEGATLPDMMAATGWQAHTLRAALTGLRKAGHDVTRHRAGEVTIYVIGPGASSAEAASADTAAEVQSDTAPAAAPVEPSA